MPRTAEQIAAYKKKWQEDNKERLSEKRRSYYLANREEIREKQAIYRAENITPERDRIYGKRYREKHPERVKERSRVNRINRKGRDLEKARAWRYTPKGRYKMYRDNARKSNREFSISFESFMEFWQKPCHYCGNMIETIGLDRVENSIGYIQQNIVSCCSVCNAMKKTLSEEFFIKQCKKIAELNINNF